MITLHDISLGFDEFHLVVEHLHLQAGLTLLVGRNGAGKSTLLSLLATASMPEKGNIIYAGKTLETSLPLIRSHMGYMPSGLELYEEMTVERQLGYLAELKGIYDKQEINILLSEFELESFRKRKLRTLSQGVKQRAAIAQAFLGSPAFLLLDEPLNHLDILERKRVISMVARYAKRHLIVVATHELSEWGNEQVERILWLDRGRVHFYDTVERWMRHLPERVWAGSVPLAELESLDKQRISQLKLLGNQAEIRLLARQAPDDRFVEVQPTLEDAYFIHTGTAISSFY
ncbi:ATP-binding cassette domain-containing protein [Paenibacillus eucommiae]|uniref:ABC-2 type transport system ATP-binding protein n=1 Tax=Paenibacillus eucommiae TaxID=1355755 RepID=A0ABS4J539_9BACL|nr:ABC transporter ATP-binding protein [Paenibacillus eucommiae]MBP1994953.1 ABC-2 type transport system ATP-binding protein [Paenibacillus eucommiae]